MNKGIRAKVEGEYKRQCEVKPYWEIKTNEFIFECVYNLGLAPNATTVERELRRLKAIDKATQDK